MGLMEVYVDVLEVQAMETFGVMNMDSKVVFMAGNLSEGYEVFGPFLDHDEAFAWADKNNKEGWAMTLYSPTEPLANVEFTENQIMFFRNEMCNEDGGAVATLGSAIDTLEQIDSDEAMEWCDDELGLLDDENVELFIESIKALAMKYGRDTELQVLLAANTKGIK